jgi:hypothetical protein
MYLQAINEIQRLNTSASNSVNRECNGGCSPSTTCAQFIHISLCNWSNTLPWVTQTGSTCMPMCRSHKYGNFSANSVKLQCNNFKHHVIVLRHKCVKYYKCQRHVRHLCLITFQVQFNSFSNSASYMYVLKFNILICVTHQQGLVHYYQKENQRAIFCLD